MPLQAPGSVDGRQGMVARGRLAGLRLRENLGEESLRAGRAGGERRVPGGRGLGGAGGGGGARQCEV